MAKSQKSSSSTFIPVKKTVYDFGRSQEELEYLARMGLIRGKLEKRDPLTGKVTREEIAQSLDIHDFAFKHPDEIVLLASQFIRFKEEVEQTLKYHGYFHRYVAGELHKTENAYKSIQYDYKQIIELVNEAWSAIISKYNQVVDLTQRILRLVESRMLVGYQNLEKHSDEKS